MLAALVDHIWRERNRRSHGKLYRILVQVLEDISFDVRTQINSKQGYPATQVNRVMGARWGLIDSVVKPVNIG